MACLVFKKIDKICFEKYVFTNKLQISKRDNYFIYIYIYKMCYTNTFNININKIFHQNAN